VANSRGHRHEENVAKLVNVALEQPLHVGVALLASVEGYTPRATQLIEAARERIAAIPEVAFALSENLPAPKTHAKSRRRRRRKRKKGPAPDGAQAQAEGETPTPAAEAPSEDGAEPKAKPKPRRRRTKSAEA
jgi:hypothetical protein